MNVDASGREVRADHRSLRVLVLSSLYPSASRPRHGIFVETRLRRICAAGDVDAQVVAPVPWFPFRWSAFGQYAVLASTPRREQRFGIDIAHPRYPMLPKVGTALQPHAVAIAALRELAKLRRRGFDCDVIDAHYFYPDGVAAGVLSRWIGRPFVVTARGSDLNVVAEKPRARTRIVEAARRAARVLCVSAALRERAIGIGIPEAKLEVSRNGVDTALFDIRARAESRRRLGMASPGEPLLLCVGNLVPGKGHALAIDALSRLHECRLLLIGEGAERAHLESRAKRNGVGARVAFMPSMPQDALVDAYNAADVLVHPSEREGWPNVVLESIACGTPVVATDAGGTGEIVCDGAAGTVVMTRSADDLANAIRSLLACLPERETVRRHALSFGWTTVAQRCLQVLDSAAAVGTRNAVEHARCAT